MAGNKQPINKERGRLRGEVSSNMSNVALKED